MPLLLKSLLTPSFNQRKANEKKVLHLDPLYTRYNLAYYLACLLMELVWVSFMLVFQHLADGV